MFSFEHHSHHWSFADTAHAVKLSHDTAPIRILEGPPASLQNSELLKNWNEFLTGMQMLYRHRQRINASTDDIACANLQLLHNNLRTSPGYKDLLHDLKQYTRQQSLLYHWPLTETNSAGCSLIGFNRNVINEINIKDLLMRITQRYFNNIVTNTHMTPLTCMYLVTSGKLLVSRNTTAAYPALASLHNKTYSITSYKSGDVLLIRDDDESIIDIRTTQKNTQLFGVYITELPYSSGR